MAATDALAVPQDRDTTEHVEGVQDADHAGGEQEAAQLPDSLVRGLHHFGARALPLLEALAASGPAQRAAVAALGELGAVAAPALPLLAELSASEDPDLRAAGSFLHARRGGR